MLGDNMTNRELGNLIGVTFSMASRLQSGDRTPGIETMQRIQDAFDWPIDDQAKLRKKGGKTYARELNRRITVWERTHQPAVEASA